MNTPAEHADDRAPLRVPLGLAEQRGVEWLVGQAADRRVVLTSHGRAVSVIDDPARAAAAERLLRGAASHLLTAAADLAAGRAGPPRDLAEACRHLGIDSTRVRHRARRLAG